MRLGMDTHFFLGSKGGIGKSLASSFLASLFQRNEQAVHCFDTDPQNHTLGGYTAFPVKVLDLIDRDTQQVNTRHFDAFMENDLLPLAEVEKAQVVVDNGSATYLPLCAYMAENPVIPMLQNLGQVFIHCLVTGGQAQDETLRCLETLLRAFSSARFVLWLNRFFGSLDRNGKPFESFDIYAANLDKIHALVKIPHLNRDTYGKDVEDLLAAKLTVAQAAAGSDGKRQRFGIMATQRLLIFERQMNNELEKARLL